ncbi:DMT family transporter [Polaromonas sp. YR568]|uniref:DMT family transporter n=1 Tax=Polaromonas sp. YR568 TaxID=1855301 RepID=UPI0031376F0A
MPPLRLALLVSLAMLAFAGNSLLCRMALKATSAGDSGIDAASFTVMRMVSGACVLWLLVQLRGGAQRSVTLGGNWLSAAALFAYAMCFSLAYVSMPAATGALLLFGAVQASMTGYGLWQGERLGRRQLAGLALALAGLVVLMLPGLATPSLLSAVLMITAGVSWGIYSVRGKRGSAPGAAATDPTRETAGNFVRTVPMVLLWALIARHQLTPDGTGLWLAFLSGAVTSGLGYAIWYHALPALKTTQAAVVQLSVPVIAALGGVVLLAESLSLPMVLASAAVLGGIALVTLVRK